MKGRKKSRRRINLVKMKRRCQVLTIDPGLVPNNNIDDWIKEYRRLGTIVFK